jgi:hypothetical protein
MWTLTHHPRFSPGPVWNGFGHCLQQTRKESTKSLCFSSSLGTTTKGEGFKHGSQNCVWKFWKLPRVWKHLSTSVQSTQRRVSSKMGRWGVCEPTPTSGSRVPLHRFPDRVGEPGRTGQDVQSTGKSRGFRHSHCTSIPATGSFAFCSKGDEDDCYWMAGQRELETLGCGSPTCAGSFVRKELLSWGQGTRESPCLSG